MWKAQKVVILKVAFHSNYVINSNWLDNESFIQDIPW